MRLEETALDYIALGKKIYRMNNPREARRCAVFVMRCLLHPHRMEKLEAYFAQNAALSRLADVYPFVYEQPTRAFFYYHATFEERAALVEQHMRFLLEHLHEDVFLGLYQEHPVMLWQSEDEGESLKLQLGFHPGQRKEGLLSVVLHLGDAVLYQIMFWIAPDKAGNMAMWIGAMQGPNMVHAKDVIKAVTKRCHSYRTKNLILHAAQEVARVLGLNRIYAVTNEGYYANNHVRLDRKLKTSFSDFWKESGGTPCEDTRFYSLPLAEHRKPMEEIPTRKRANYRRRYAMLDAIDASVASSMNAIKKASGTDRKD